VYAGCIETVDYQEAENAEGFCHVKVDEKGSASLEFVKLESPRKFLAIDQDFSGLPSSKISTRAKFVCEVACALGFASFIDGDLPGNTRSIVWRARPTLSHLKKGI
jgi:hypothetical protein